jgi:WhiB family transcriptional regulator, redox-sensing transcriptional regulator
MKTEQLYLALADAIREAETNPPCQETDPEAFYSEKGDWGSIRQAKKLCESCPVIKECGEYAIAAMEPYGVWGGLTPKERVAVRRLANY